jgi:hypothetical protein
VSLEFETSNNAEISTSTSYRPEQVIVLRNARGQHSSIGHYYLRRQQIVDRHSVLTNQPADPTSERQATNTGLRHYAARHREAEDVRFSIEVTKSGSALYSNSARPTIHENGSHAGQIDDQPVVAEPTTAYVVPAATNRRRQIVRASEIDRGNHVSNAGALSDHPRMFADTSIPDLTGLVVADIRWLENLAVKYGSERFDIDVEHGWD